MMPSKKALIYSIILGIILSAITLFVLHLFGSCEALYARPNTVKNEYGLLDSTMVSIVRYSEFGYSDKLHSYTNRSLLDEWYNVHSFSAFGRTKNVEEIEKGVFNPPKVEMVIKAVQQGHLKSFICFAIVWTILIYLIKRKN